VAREYLHHLVPWFSIPKWIILDRDLCFASQFSQTLCHNLGVQQNISTAFYPRTDGQTEQMNAWVEQYLRQWTIGRQMNWATLLSMAEYAHNSWKHKVTKALPHKLLLGFKPQVNIKFLSDIAPMVVNWLHTLEEAQKEAQMWLETLQKSKDSCKPRQLMQGDDVWLKAKNLAVKGMRKLLPKWYGPFKVLECIRQVVSYFHCPQLLTELNLILSYQSGHIFLYLIDGYLFDHWLMDTD